MEEYSENLYETRTNLFSSENIIEYLWRRCERNTFPFKPDNSFGFKCRQIDKKYLRGKEILEDFVLNTKDIKNADFKNGNEYNFEIVEYENLNMDNVPVSLGKVVLIYKSDRKFYSLFDLEERNDGYKYLNLIMKVKQKVGLLGSFQTEMIYYY